MKILAVQNRKGIGDMVIFLPFIEAIAKKFNTKINILVKENSKAAQILKNNTYIDQIIILDRDNKYKNGKHDGLKGSFKLINDLKKYEFDKVFIFNSSLRFYLITKLAGIKNIYQYPRLGKKNQHIIQTAQNFIEKELNLKVPSNPKIFINLDDINYAKSKYKILDGQINILLGIGGSGDTKRVPSNIFLNFMKLCSENYDCKFFLATGKKDDEQKLLNEILKSEFKDKCLSLDQLNLIDTLPIIKNCKISICNDSSFSHLSAALGIETIVLMADTPLLYGSYSPKMHPILPEGEVSVTHDTLGKKKINPEKIFNEFKKILF
mgnify:CR=1 FL=1|tara:strand:+ start:22 stop:987 length:966 start_codon:yes stop_codon:yes gene_type:complete